MSQWVLLGPNPGVHPLLRLTHLEEFMDLGNHLRCPVDKGLEVPPEGCSYEYERMSIPGLSRGAIEHLEKEK